MPAGLFTIVFGSVGSWLASLGLYAIGETEERTASMRAELAELRKELQRLKSAPAGTGAE